MAPSEALTPQNTARNDAFSAPMFPRYPHFVKNTKMKFFSCMLLSVQAAGSSQKTHKQRAYSGTPCCREDSQAPSSPCYLEMGPSAVLEALVTFMTWNVDCFHGQAPKDGPLKPDQEQSLALWVQMCATSTA